MPDVALAAGQYVAHPDVVACDLADGLALLDLRSNMYFSLNPVGAFLWSQLKDGASVDALRDAVLSRYDVGEAACRQDVDAILRSFVTAKLIRPADAAAE